MSGDHGALMRRLRSGTLNAFMIRGVGVGLLFLMHALLARNLGVEAYGVFSYAMSLAGLLAVIVPLGWPNALIRFVAEYREQKKWGLFRGALVRSHQIVLAIAVFICALLWLVSYQSNATDEMQIAIWYAGAILPFIVLSALRRSALNGVQRIREGLIPDEILVPLIFLLILFFFSSLNISLTLQGYIFSLFISFLVGTFWLWKFMPKDVFVACSVYRTKDWMATALPMLFGGIGRTIINRTDVLMLGAILSMQSVGMYSAANRIATLCLFMVSAVETIAAPMLAESYHGGRYDQFRQIMRSSRLWAVVGSLPLVLPMLFFPELLLKLFGDEFASDGAIMLLQLLAIAKFTKALSTPCGFALLMAGEEWRFALMMAMVASVNLLGNFFAIPVWGALGAAYVTVICMMTLNFWQWAASRKLFGVK